MPRISAEARAAAPFRALARIPDPPEWLSDEGAAHWRAIVAAKPSGWFDAGNLPLLGQYCATLAQAQKVAQQLAVAEDGVKSIYGLEMRLMGLNGSCATLATKLRLSVQGAVDRKSRMLEKSGPGEEVAADPLLGGKVHRLHA